MSLQNPEKPKLHGFLQEQLRQRRTWSRPREKREPIAFRIFEVLQVQVSVLAQSDPFYFTSKSAAVYDYSRLGALTGSRVSEYAQGNLEPGVRFNTVPLSADAGEWAGSPIAFIAPDFTFYDNNFICLSHDIVVSDSQRVMEVHVRFRYDKSSTNFAIRKFRRVSSLLCPVDASTSIIRRATLLRVPPTEPLGVFAAGSASYSFLRAQHMVDALRAAAVVAYPNPQHYLRLHLHCVVSHSLRVTAAVLMHNPGYPAEIIAFRLRWSVDSVKFYIREARTQVCQQTTNAIFGAMLI